jgi:antitoxin HicB
MPTNKHKGSHFDNFLEEENILEDAEAVAIKRVIAFELEKKIKKVHLSKSEIAQKMHTSRSALDRLLDPNNTSITLSTLVKAAHFAGKKLKVSFV